MKKKKNVISEKSLKFAVRIVKFYQYLCDTLSISLILLLRKLTKLNIGLNFYGCLELSQMNHSIH